MGYKLNIEGFEGQDIEDGARYTVHGARIPQFREILVVTVNLEPCTLNLVPFLCTLRLKQGVGFSKELFIREMRGQRFRVRQGPEHLAHTPHVVGHLGHRGFAGQSGGGRNLVSRPAATAWRESRDFPMPKRRTSSFASTRVSSAPTRTG